ncbi:hypothetical protein GZL_01760 [Streptomyces sp. 769]|nr:hypothetical protein GZL_01760 [Streptomyces sp. 769]
MAPRRAGRGAGRGPDGARPSAALLLCSALGLATTTRPVPPDRMCTAIRNHERRTAFLPQRKPDAAGRPRAPG